MEITSIDGNWVKGTLRVNTRLFAFSAKVFPKPNSNYGVTDPTGDGHISKLTVTDEREEDVVINYDRGWDVQDIAPAEVIWKIETEELLNAVEQNL